jgi:hypothetical protein
VLRADEERPAYNLQVHEHLGGRHVAPFQYFQGAADRGAPLHQAHVIEARQIAPIHVMADVHMPDALEGRV